MACLEALASAMTTFLTCPELGKTMAELPLEAKIRLSHRFNVLPGKPVTFWNGGLRGNSSMTGLSDSFSAPHRLPAHIRYRPLQPAVHLLHAPEEGVDLFPERTCFPMRKSTVCSPGPPPNSVSPEPRLTGANLWSGGVESASRHAAPGSTASPTLP